MLHDASHAVTEGDELVDDGFHIVLHTFDVRLWIVRHCLRQTVDLL